MPITDQFVSAPNVPRVSSYAAQMKCIVDAYSAHHTAVFASTRILVDTTTAIWADFDVAVAAATSTRSPELRKAELAARVAVRVAQDEHAKRIAPTDWAIDTAEWNYPDAALALATARKAVLADLLD